MYEFLIGRVVEKSLVSVVLDIQGIGYKLSIPVSTSSAVPALGETMRLLTHFVVREDAHALYGFATEEERQMFRLLISISGIGPKLGIAILSGKSIPELRRAIVDGSLIQLTSIPGVGKKTAERIIIELREKVVLEDKKHPSLGVSKSGIEDALIEDSIRALVELGYRKQNAKEAVQKVLQSTGDASLNASEIIRASLKYI